MPKHIDVLEAIMKIMIYIYCVMLMYLIMSRSTFSLSSVFLGKAREILSTLCGHFVTT